ncbi:MAG: RidA family protein [Flavobacteriaceae bacterium]|nr:RidA family protein [Flavobacteriaceae bacterium]
MDRKIINTENAPKPIGPYNQAILANNILFISGQIGINPKTNILITGDIENETIQVMLNLKAILNSSNMSFKNVVKTTIYLKNMDDFSLVNEVYSKYFNKKNAPARETVEVSKLPKDVNVEISMIAI